MKQQGFSLIELMIAVVIIGVIAAIALPMASEHSLKARRAIAKGALMDIQSTQESFFINNKTYASDLASLNYDSPLYIDDNAASVQNTVALAQGFYQISLVAVTLSYTITATPINSQLKDTDCLVLSITNTGVKGASGAQGAARCW